MQSASDAGHRGDQPREEAATDGRAAQHDILLPGIDLTADVPDAPDLSRESGDMLWGDTLSGDFAAPAALEGD